ncbi:DUF3450 domain-containing protein [Shewanella sp. D64]|uniref:DUF3450 family protein n=1 Tax=unclassified Shewanella TaxID=196818 RepID=UPI0022BA384F|nr:MULTISPECIES: DUF3450 family protein [unclassified Shewanella]MEC4727655.1 DUF3450 domain-containing protein [Shewanella sp. D64]MEC4739772.1 DUF3450 domain-containing protein [Shewanella sp. E94]WBJ94054.1 DUF3450 domain-containing protein [Shewanella sp. MTB7]
MKISSFFYKSSKTNILLVSQSLALLLLSIQGVSAQGVVAEADDLVAKWLNLEQQSNALSSHWIMSKPVLEQRVELLKREELQLKNLLSADHSATTQVEAKRSELLALQNNMESDQATLSQWVNVELSQVQGIIEQLPPPLAKSWRAAIKEKHINIQSSDSVSVEPAKSKVNSIDTTSSKLELLLSLYLQLNEFEQRVSSYETQIETLDGEVRLVKQLYLGISRGWYVTLDSQSVAEGVSTVTGWRWQVNESLTPDTIETALMMIAHKKEANFIELPFSLTVDAKQTQTLDRVAGASDE